MKHNVLCKYTYIIFSDGGKLASSNCKTAPTLPKKGKKKNDCHRSRISLTESENLPKVILMLAYWINRRHGIVYEVILFLLWGHCVTEANVSVLLIPTVTPSTDETYMNTLLRKKQQKSAL